MKKLLFFFPFILSAYYYPLNYQFVFMRNCMQNSSLTNKYEYCKCVFEKIKETYPYDYFAFHSSDTDVLSKIAIFSKECLNK